MKTKPTGLSPQYFGVLKQLKLETGQRRIVEKALKESERHYRLLLEESGRTNEHLRHLSRQILSAQEEERKEISRKLHDEIAQTLLGINVRLETLKREALVNVDGLKAEISNTQRLVERSVKSIQRFAREFGIPKRK